MNLIKEYTSKICRIGGKKDDDLKQFDYFEILKAKKIKKMKLYYDKLD
jgi:hypothetical protein